MILLSDRGAIVRTNSELLQNFNPMPSPDPPDYGLDAVHRATSDEIWFSIEQPFWDELLGVSVGHGDLLSDILPMALFAVGICTIAVLRFSKRVS